MEDVNICSGASRGSPSLSGDCSEHINISGAKGTSGKAVPECVCENRWKGGGVDDSVCCRKTHTHTYTDSAPLPDSSGL